MERGYESPAKNIYALGKWQNDPLAVNNWLVLDYRKKRYDSALSPDEKRQNTKAMHAALKELRKSNLPAAEYNLALFNYGCSTKSRCFDIGVERFERAAQLGDPLAANAVLMMQRRKIPKQNKAKRSAFLKQAADNHEPHAAYRYAREIYRDDPEAGQYYGLMAVKSGSADAQAFMGRYFNRSDKEYWLQKAATNPSNRSLMAANDLGKIYEDQGDIENAVKWYEIATQPRGTYQHDLVIREDGLRWRSLQGSRAADANTSNSAAYRLALLRGNNDAHKKEFAENMHKASLVEWNDSDLIEAQLKYREAPRHAKTMQAKNVAAANLKFFEASSYGKLLAPLKPMIAAGHIRYATELDLSDWKSEPDYQRIKSKCKAVRNCFVVNAPITLGGGMNGSHSAVFVIPQNVQAPRAEKSHNKYLFLGGMTREVRLKE